MFLGDLRPTARPRHQLLLGQQIVREDSGEIPNLVQQLQFGRSVIAQVSDGFSDSGPVLLLDMSPIVLVARPRPGERDLMLDAVGQEMLVDEFRPLIGIDADERKRGHADHVFQGLEYPFRGLVLHRPIHRPAGADVSHGQGEAVLAAYVSTFVSPNPASVPVDEVDLDELPTASPHSAQVRTGIWDFSNDPDFVWDRLLGSIFLR